MPGSETQSNASIREEIFNEDPDIFTQSERDGITRAFGNGPAEGCATPEADDGTQNGGTEASQNGGQ
ncbi:hypothetical protein L202_02582 [Cryptococcus amylolentus CBS 6039]|uniref:Uncharacterized protein n=1 Tax=Cryptococcus amylolentus CBS 6039 TaxID=1295533 RepID=A0A1E3I133_9TREE|nr:hypothetical protein L202_02582 [Cryptococcus amylolentus CBS 6039]ODN82304.1 hypothetical protein L202_02582 [Cryptococcus amylolentus CBS 6039]